MVGDDGVKLFAVWANLVGSKGDRDDFPESLQQLAATAGRVIDATVPTEQLKNAAACAQIATTPAHQTSTRERGRRLLDTCIARAAGT